MEVTQKAREVWSKLARCQTDRYFGNRTKMDKELEVLARFEAEIASTAQAEAAALRAGVEALGEALHGLSAMLLLTNALEDDKTHAAYEKVVARFAALTERSQ